MLQDAALEGVEDAGSNSTLSMGILRIEIFPRTLFTTFVEVSWKLAMSCRQTSVDMDSRTCMEQG